MLVDPYILSRRRRVASIERFRESLIEREMAFATIDKYVRDVSYFLESIDEENAFQPLTKQAVINYKSLLITRYAPASVNSMLAAMNCYLGFMHRPNLKAKYVKIQKETYRNEAQELTKEEYDLLVATAKKMGRTRMALIIQTLCSTGMRVSELQFVTVEAVREGRLIITNKGKTRCVWLTEKLRRILLMWAADHGCSSGTIFTTRSGCPVDRVYLWREMKLVANAAGIEPSKVFPHNLRHLFACMYYGKYLDIAALSDLLGHSRIETTRIYVMSSGKEQRTQVANLDLVA